MLFIGDIHIHHRHAPSIIQMLRQYISSCADETHIIFVGDFVYHFNYHRPSLLLLLDFFLELVREGKIVYILAGNHDRIGQHFVYEEARRMIISMRAWESERDNSDGIHFITQPEVFTIEWEKILMLPYMLNRKDYMSESEVIQQYDTIVPEVLQHSSNPMEVQSRYLNQYLANVLETESMKEWEKVSMIVHHYYTAQTKFPWLKVQFHYKDLALSPYRLTRDAIKLISGHIHHTFSIGNYLCIGAVWSTRPTEYNLHQYLRQYTASSGVMRGTQVSFNPYLELEIGDSTQTQESVQEFWQMIHQQTEVFLQSSQRQTSIQLLNTIPRDRLTLSILSNDASYETLQTHVDPALRSLVKETKLKRSSEAIQVLEQERADSAADFRHSWSDRKTLLDNYLKEKFADRYPVYDQMVKKLGIG